MSMPIIEKPTNPVDRDQSVSDLIESVALMEAGLSHVINAEGEKIQKVVDPDADYPLEDIVAVNNSAEKMINTISKLEMMLQSKLEVTKDFDNGTTPGPGPQPTPGVGAIIPYSGQITMNTTLAGLPDQASLLTFSTINTAYDFPLNGNPEEYTLPLNVGTFSMPRNGTITSLSAFFDLNSNTAAETQVIARVYASESYSSTYRPLAGAIVNLSPVIPTGSTQLNLVGSVNGLNIPVTVDTKLVLVFYCTSTVGIAVSIGGSAGGAINIE